MTLTLAIPTHGRSHLLERTIAAIRSYGFREDIYAFVDNFEAQQEYRHVGGCKFVITNSTGIQKTRNFIYTYFPEGTFVLCFDDSFTGLSIKKAGRLEKFNKVVELSKIAYQEMRRKGTCFFGVNLVENPFFMKGGFQFGNYPLSAKFCGFISQPFPLMCSTNPSGLCEDQETSLRVTKHYGGVLRFSGITFDKPEYRKHAGGVQASFSVEERRVAEQLGNKYLAVMFPELCKLKKTGVGLRYARL